VQLYTIYATFKISASFVELLSTDEISEFSKWKFIYFNNFDWNHCCNFCTFWTHHPEVLKYNKSHLIIWSLCNWQLVIIHEVYFAKIMNTVCSYLKSLFYYNNSLLFIMQVCFTMMPTNSNIMQVFFHYCMYPH